MRAEHIPADKFWEAVAPLDRQAIERVFGAVRQDFAVSARDVEALHIAAALLSKQICQILAAKPPSAPKAHRAEVLRRAMQLHRQISSLKQRGYGSPPMLPLTWLAALQRWAKADLLEPGRPRKDANRIAMTRLLDLYFVAFGKAPSHTAKGPTERFLEAWQKEVSAAAAANADLEGAVARLPKLNASNSRKLIQDWRADSLRRRIGQKTFWSVVLALDPSRGEIHRRA